MSIDLDELERKARAATPGPWEAPTHPESIVNVWSAVRNIAHEVTGPDAEYMAAANPAVILELVARLRAAEGIARDLAKSDPLSRQGFQCRMCIGEILIDPPDRSQVGVFVHDESCPYRRAAEFVDTSR